MKIIKRYKTVRYLECFLKKSSENVSVILKKRLPFEVVRYLEISISRGLTVE